MSRIERDDASRIAAEDARRRAEERAARARASAPAPPAPPAGDATPRTPPVADVMERAPRLFGREIVWDGPAVPPHIEAPPPPPVPPQVPRPAEAPLPPQTDVLPRARVAPRRDASGTAGFDRRQLLSALGAPAPPSPTVAPAASAVASAHASAPAGVSPAAPLSDVHALLAVKPVAWSEAAPRILGATLRSVAEQAGSLESRAAHIKEVLSGIDTRNARTLVGFRTAGGLLEKTAYHAAVARELSRLGPGPAATLPRMDAARQELSGAERHAGEAESALRELAATAPQTPWAVGQVQQLQQAALAARVQMTQTEGRAQILAEMDTKAAPAPASPAPASASAPAEFEFGDEDLARIGSALDPTKPPVQTHWSEQMVNTVCELGRKQGGVTDEQGAKNFELAKVVLGSEDGTAPKELGAADLAAVLKMSGVDLAKVDPSQLQAAARYVSGATSPAEQQDKLRKAIDNFQVLEKIGLPKLTRQQMVDELWGVAKVPGHALAGLSDAEIQKKLQEVLATVNAGPGKAEIKIGKYNLKLEVGQSGAVTQSSCKKPGFLSKLWSAVKVVAPIALTVMSFIPVTAPFALAAQAAIGMVQAIKAKSILGIAAAAASVVGAGAGAASLVGKIANSASRALQGVSSIKSGNLLGGLAAIGSGVASGIGAFADKIGARFANIANRLQNVSSRLSAVGTGVASFEAYKQASRALEQAKQALRAAQASGDARAIASAEKQLAQAESQKRTAAIGGAAGAFTAASAIAGSRSLFANQTKAVPPAQTRLESNLQLVARGLGVAQGVAGKDFTSAAVSALSLGATVRSAQNGGKENRLNQIANMAQAELGYYQSEKARTTANRAVADAQGRLDAARRSGNAEEVRRAEAELAQARGSAESALIGKIAAGESLLTTAKDIGDQYRKEKAERQKASSALKAANDSAQAGQQTGERLAKLAQDPKASPAAREAAAALKEQLDAADAEFQRAMLAAKGDPDKIAKALDAFEDVRTGAAASEAALTRSIPASLATDGSRTDDAEAPGFASLRRPQKIGSARVEKGVTLWEVSQRTGVPVERILEFNEQSGNPLDPARLQIGQQILVPMDKEDIKFDPLSAEQVRALKQKAAEKKERESMAVPSVRSSDDAPPLAPDDLRSRALQALGNDRSLISEDAKSAEFKFSDPTTWVDTKEEAARTQARDAFRQSVDRLESVLQDPKSTEAQIHAALIAKQAALNSYSAAKNAAERGNQNVNYVTPVAEAYRANVAEPVHDQLKKVADAIDGSSLPDLVKGAVKLPVEIIDKEVAFDFKGAVQSGQDFLHSATREGIEAIENMGVPASVAAAATLPLHLADGTIDFVAGVDKGAVSLVEGLVNMGVHPADAAMGLGQLGMRAMEADPSGRALLFLTDVARGKFKTGDELMQGMKDSTDPVLMAKAGFDLGGDVAKGVFADSIKLVHEGKYEEALGTVVGQFLDVVVGAGAAKVARISRTAEALSEASKVEHAAEVASQTTRTAETLDETAKAGRVVEQTGAVADETVRATSAAGQTAAAAAEAAPVGERAAATAAETGQASRRTAVVGETSEGAGLSEGSRIAEGPPGPRAASAPTEGLTAAESAPRPTPRQRVTDFEELYKEAEVAQQELSQVTKDVAEATGGKAVIPALKGRERALEKIAVDYGGDSSGILDLARSSVEFETLDDVYKAVEQLGERAKIVRIKDRFAVPTAEGYRDLLLNVEMGNGHIAEVQFHLRSVLQVKNGVGHALYEEIRSIEAAAVQGNRPLTAAEVGHIEELRGQARIIYDQAFESSRPKAVGETSNTGPGRTSAVGAGDRIVPKTTGTPEVSFLFDESGLTVRAEGQITGPHRGRGKGYRPEPAGGREPGDHRGHLIPEGGVEDPRLVNVKPNIISEAPRSNLGAKKIFDNLVSRIAAENPNSVIKVIAEPLRRPGQRRPFAVTYWIEKDGVRIHGQSILNKK